MTADEIKKYLKLEPHPCEGGSFLQTWRAEEAIPQSALPSRYQGERYAGTCIYYLLEPGTFSEMHRLASDEIFHFYVGDPIEMLQLLPDGSSRTLVLGNDLAAGQHPQLIVPKHVWQGSRLMPGGSVALLGCTVSPGFDYTDYETGHYEPLAGQYPDAEEMIRALTRH
ncbi:cupin domain-containing protein [Silvibacterium acidisoli]|uniref:cupin domain-containing protein n=1 Tax=Acidobacteriaceae bacterium ZG23-2 TaxID=2883246 RepID=UPI00406BF9C6